MDGFIDSDMDGFIDSDMDGFIDGFIVDGFIDSDMDGFIVSFKEVANTLFKLFAASLSDSFLVQQFARLHSGLHPSLHNVSHIVSENKLSKL